MQRSLQESSEDGWTVHASCDRKGSINVIPGEPRKTWNPRRNPLVIHDGKELETLLLSLK